MSDILRQTARDVCKSVDHWIMVGGDDAVREAIEAALTTARSEGFAAGEASMREKAKRTAENCGCFTVDRDGYRVELAEPNPMAFEIAATIAALPPSSPAVWTAEQEREAIVKWLNSDDRKGIGAGLLKWASDRIGEGRHLPKEQADG